MNCFEGYQQFSMNVVQSTTTLLLACALAAHLLLACWLSQTYVAPVLAIPAARSIDVRTWSAFCQLIDLNAKVDAQSCIVLDTAPCPSLQSHCKHAAPLRSTVPWWCEQ